MTLTARKKRQKQQDNEKHNLILLSKQLKFKLLAEEAGTVERIVGYTIEISSKLGPKALTELIQQVDPNLKIKLNWTDSHKYLVGVDNETIKILRKASV